MIKSKKNRSNFLSSKMSNESISEEIEYMQMNMHDVQPERVPRGIETEENRIYFYCPIGDREALELNRLIRRLDVEMQYLQN